MIINLNENWKWKYFQLPYYRVKEALSNFYFKHHKKIYTCRICGKKAAPFLEITYNSLPYSYGWHQFKDGSWACHHCVDHYGDKSTEEWNNMVKQSNHLLYKDLIKRGYIKHKNPEFKYRG